MNILALIENLKIVLTNYLSQNIFNKFTGKLIITINFKNGGIGTLNVSTSQDYKPKDLS